MISPKLFHEDVSALEQMLAEHARAGRGDEDRLSRQLGVVALFARQFLNSMSKGGAAKGIGRERCGKYCENIPGAPPRQKHLELYRACNALIHAEGELQYEFNAKVDAVLITIHGTKEIRDEIRHTEAELQGMAFAELCKMISSIVVRSRRGGEVQEGGSRAYEASTVQPMEERAMADKRDTYVYTFDVGNRTVEAGITRDLDAREDELRRKYTYSYSFIEQMGLEPMTRAEAERTAREMLAEGYPVNMKTLKQP